MKLFGYRARTHRDWSVFHRSSNQCSMNQTVFAPKFETFPRIFSSIYWMFSCRGARNDRHRLLIAGFPPLYRGWINRASSLSSLQDSSSLRVLRCSRLSCVERFDCGKFFLEEMKERMMRRVDVNNKIFSFFFFLVKRICWIAKEENVNGRVIVLQHLFLLLFFTHSLRENFTRK